MVKAGFMPCSLTVSGTDSSHARLHKRRLMWKARWVGDIFDLPFEEMRAAIKLVGGFSAMPSYAGYIQLEEKLNAMCGFRRRLSFRVRREWTAMWRQVVDELRESMGNYDEIGFWVCVGRQYERAMIDESN